MKLKINKEITLFALFSSLLFFSKNTFSEENFDFNIVKIDHNYSIVEIDFDKKNLDFNNSFENEELEKINYENIKDISYKKVCENKSILKLFSNIDFHLDIEISINSEKYALVKDINSCLYKDSNFENK